MLLKRSQTEQKKVRVRNRDQSVNFMTRIIGSIYQRTTFSHERSTGEGGELVACDWWPQERFGLPLRNLEAKICRRREEIGNRGK